jgi:hypothetical protein
MSEDCHDSNNAATQIGSQVACLYCGKATTPGDAYLCEFENSDGSTYTVVFHKGIDTLCALKWAAERMEAISGKLEAILALFKYVDDGRD